MNMHTAPQRTAAETALVDAFAARLAELPGDAAVAMKRDGAVERLKRGLPTRKVEAWHYTDLRRLLSTVPAHDATAHVERSDALVDGASVLALLNGRAVGDAPMLDGAAIGTVRERLVDGSLAELLGMAGDDDVVGALNAAFVADGWQIDIADGAQIERPIEIQALHAGGQSHQRVPVRVGAGARATIIERQSGEGAALVSSVSHLTVGEGANVTWVILIDQPDTATHLGQFNAEIGANGALTLFVMTTGGKLVRQEVRIKVAGEGADFTLRGCNLIAGDSHVDVTMALDHGVPSTTSTEVIRNIITDRGHGVFQGKIVVDRLAQKTDARMACNTMLLSDDADFSTKPELEIFADDVACGHGATVAEIDHSHLFYLMARGIDEKTARGLLVKAFLAEVIEELDNEPIVEALEARLDTWFAAHG